MIQSGKGYSVGLQLKLVNRFVYLAIIAIIITRSYANSNQQSSCLHSISIQMY